MSARVRVALVAGAGTIAGALIVLGFRSQQVPQVPRADSSAALPVTVPAAAPVASVLPSSVPASSMPAESDRASTAAVPCTEPRALLQQARAHLDAGRPADAAPLVQRALALQPGNSGAWNVLGRTELLRLHPREAEAAFRRACALDSTNAYAHNNLGLLYLQQSRWTEALPWLERAVCLQGGVAYFHNNLGVVYERLQRWEDASAAYAKAVDLDPARVNARLSLARVSAHLDAALAAAPSPVDSLFPERADPSDR